MPTHLTLDLDLQVSVGHPFSIERRNDLVGLYVATCAFTYLLELKRSLYHACLTKESGRIVQFSLGEELALSLDIRIALLI